jgi:hypothetical protein
MASWNAAPRKAFTGQPPRRAPRSSRTHPVRQPLQARAESRFQNRAQQRKTVRAAAGKAIVYVSPGPRAVKLEKGRRFFIRNGPDKVEMHLNADFFTHQFLWTLTFAAQLVLLMILLGRDRAQRYPWFTTGVVLAALQLMAGVLLSGRMAMLPLQEMMLALADTAVIVGLMVLVEVARRAFSGLQRSLWIVNAAGLVIAAGGVLVVWAPWPVWSSLAVNTLMGKLRLMQLVAQKGDTLVDLLTVGLGLLVVVFGRRF